MLQIPTFIVKKADRIWGDTIEKVAFNVNIDPASILGAIGGSYAATRVHNNIQTEKQEELASQQTLEGDHYSQVGAILSNLKIVFTPINVVYSVNNQVFDIIDAGEMTPHMRSAFMKKDANFFRDILVNKMNMEMQLAEQAFAKRLLAKNHQFKEASFVERQEYLLKVSKDEFIELEKTASDGLDRIGNISIPVNFDSLRPFSRSSDFFNPNEFQKVAGLFDYFKRNQTESLKLNQVKSQVKVGFLPDRVIFLHNGQLIQQISLLNMNEEGYEAFRNKDKNFFLNFFYNKSEEIADDIALKAKHDDLQDKEAKVEPEGQEKTADTLEEVVENTILSPYEKSSINIFEDSDVHPIVYEKILSDKYGDNWSDFELEAIIKQIELDFKVEKGIFDIPLNKISIFHTIASEKHTMFMNSFSFEKFIRAMNSKDIVFGEFQGNLTFEEIAFGLEVAKVFNGDDVFLEFHHTVAEYVSEELFRDNIRFVSDQVFDETNLFEKDFFDSVNGLLMRKWKEKDTQSMTDENERQEKKRLTEMITTISDNVLKEYVEEIDIADVFRSTTQLINKYQYLSNIKPDMRKSVESIVTETVVRHIGLAFFLEGKRQELKTTLAMIEEKGVKSDGNA